jgi:hypothetical protein
MLGNSLHLYPLESRLRNPKAFFSKEIKRNIPSAPTINKIFAVPFRACHFTAIHYSYATNEEGAVTQEVRTTSYMY